MPRSFHYRDGDLPLHGERHDPTGIQNGRAILIVHEADGIGNNVRRRAAMLAAEGYTAFLADMHGESRVLSGDEMTAALDRFKGDPAYFRARIRSAFDAVMAEGFTPDRIAAIGYCFGGAAVLELARSGAELAGVASFHGLLTTAASAERGAIRTRILASTGARDPLVPPADLATFQAEMDAADADWQLLVHGRALHSFTNRDVEGLGDPRMAYDAAADRQSWAALQAFLQESWANPA
ncbi:dienelactone hydrolase family protein [Sphingomonas sp. ID0503]|uniref:dienelactone hydrolase family protein n=1 Tax=Sphingomonas sp. ID0503 TaxID=3399691 RepID=UPI003AFADC46